MFWVISIILMVAGCTSPSIKIGFAGEISGKNATLGVRGRNGAALAVQQINAGGGIDGRKLELVVEDGLGTPEGILAADQRLEAQGVIALTGHMTSKETSSVMPYLEEKGLILFSPTTASPDFDQKEDHFFRLIPTNLRQSYTLAEVMFQDEGMKRAAVIYDVDNQSFSKTFTDGFGERFMALGGSVTGVYSFSAAAVQNFLPMLEEIRLQNPDMILVAASPLNTSQIAQQLDLMDWHPRLAASNWSYSDDLLILGGRTVEGIMIVTHFTPRCLSEAFIDFKQTYEAEFNQTVDFSSVLSYETMLEFGRALDECDGNYQRLKEVLSTPRQIYSLCDQVWMDETGDVARSIYLINVRNGAFEVVKTIQPKP